MFIPASGDRPGTPRPAADRPAVAARRPWLTWKYREPAMTKGIYSLCWSNGDILYNRTE